MNHSMPGYAAWPLCLAAAAIVWLGAFRAPLPVSGASPVQDSTFADGEELVYNVSYLSFDIGQVRVSCARYGDRGKRFHRPSPDRRTREYHSSISMRCTKRG
jgi:hypothetical protein